MNTRGTLGADGEGIAADYLHARGYEIVERNFRCKVGEIDIVARRGGTIVFCEVKTRRTDRWGAPSQAVDQRKQARLRSLAATWLSERATRTTEVRFDVISVVLRGGRAQVTHLPDAF